MRALTVSCTKHAGMLPEGDVISVPQTRQAVWEAALL